MSGPVRSTADDEGSVLLLTLGYAILALVLVLVCVDATSLYLAQKRADAAADAAAMWFALFAAVLGVGNGLSSGILLTLGADVAPQDDPAPFLGSWRTLTDAGGALSPLLVSAIAAALSLSAATAVVGVIGLAGAVAFVRWVPRFVPRAR